MSTKDTIFSTPRESVKPFEFDQQVVSVFEDMIQRSVPGYRELVHQIAHLAKQVVTPNSHVYDLGTSLGAVTLAVRRQVNDETVTVYAIDKSAAMVRRCKEFMTAYASPVPVVVLEQDILASKIVNASLVVLNFTLQFIAVNERAKLIETIYEGLNPGGLLVLSEKINLASKDANKLLVALHEEFKSSQGYSELEISQKRDALQDVMIPETVAAHRDRLTAAGFKTVAVWFQQYNFVSMIAIK